MNFDLASFLLSCGGPGPQTQGAAVISWATSGSKTGRDGQLTKVWQTVLVLKPRAPGTLIEADQGAGPQGQPRSPWPRPSPCARGLHRFPKYNGHSRTSLYSQGLAGRGLLWSWTRPTRGARPPAPRAPPPPVTRQRTAGPAPTRARGWRGGRRAATPPAAEAQAPPPLRPRRPGPSSSRGNCPGSKNSGFENWVFFFLRVQTLNGRKSLFWTLLHRFLAKCWILLNFSSRRMVSFGKGLTDRC